MENIIMLLIGSIIIVTTIFSEMFLTNFITIGFGLGALGAIISIPFNLIYWQQLIFNFVENSGGNKKNHQYDNLKNNFEY